MPEWLPGALLQWLLPARLPPAPPPLLLPLLWQQVKGGVGQWRVYKALIGHRWQVVHNIEVPKCTLSGVTLLFAVL